MYLTAHHQVALGAARELSVRHAPSDTVAVPADVRHLERQLHKFQALTTPGFMSLRALRRGTDVVDFEWDCADPAAVHLLRGGAAGLAGRRLVEFMADRPGRAEVYASYRRVVDFGSAKPVRHWIEIGGSPAILHHAAVPLRDGVAVILTNVSAVRRVDALRREIEVRVAMGAAGSR